MNFPHFHCYNRKDKVLTLSKINENPSSLSICEKCGEKIEREIKATEEKKERKEMTRTQQILLIIGAVLLFPLVIVGFILFFIINAITGISKGKMALDDLGVDAYSELEKEVERDNFIGKYCQRIDSE